MDTQYDDYNEFLVKMVCSESEKCVGKKFGFWKIESVGHKGEKAEKDNEYFLITIFREELRPFYAFGSNAENNKNENRAREPREILKKPFILRSLLSQLGVGRILIWIFGCQHHK